MSKQFDFDKDLTDKDGILTPLINQLAEAALKAGLVTHLEADEAPNHKNGVTRKAVKSPSGSSELDTRGSVFKCTY